MPGGRASESDKIEAGGLTLMLRILLIFSFSLLSVGCWNKDYQEPGRVEIDRKSTELVIPSNFLRVWGAAQAALGKFPILKKDAEGSLAKGYMVTDWIRGKSDTLFHGFDVNRVPYVIRYKLFVYVTGENRFNQVRVSIRVVEQYLDDMVTAGVDARGGVYTWVKTESSSLKENAILEQIKKLALDPKFKAGE